MLHLWRWINVNSSWTLVTGAILLAGVSGCRSASVYHGRSYSSGTVFEPAPSAPVPLVPAEDKGEPKTPILTPVPNTTQVVPPPEEDDSEAEIAAKKKARTPKPVDVPPIPADPVEEPVVETPVVTKEEAKPAYVEPKVTATEVEPQPVVDEEPAAPGIKVRIPEAKTAQPVETKVPVPQAEVPSLPTLDQADEPEPTFKPKAITAPVESSVKDDAPIETTPTEEPAVPALAPVRKPAVKADDLEEFFVDEERPQVQPQPVQKKVPLEVPPLPEAVQPNDAEEEAVPAPKKAPLLPTRELNEEDFKDTVEEPAAESKPALPPLPKISEPKPLPEPAAEPVKELDADPFEPVDENKPKAVRRESDPRKTATASQLNSTFPAIAPGPKANKNERPFSLKLPEPEPVRQVPVPKPVAPKPAPRIIGPLPDGAPQTNATPADKGSTSKDLAQFEATADNIVVGDDGSIYVSHRTAITRIAANGQAEVWSQTGAPRGHIILTDGSHVVCDASQRAVLKLDAEGNLIEKLATKSGGYFLRAPHDLVSDSEGGIYFTDPGYARVRNTIGQIHYVTRNGQVNVVAQKLAYPEGIAISADGSKLYAIESQTNQLLSFEVLAPGKVGARTVLSKLSDEFNKNGEGSASGLTIDNDGRLYVAHRDANRIEVIDADGRAVTTYSCGNLSVSDVALLNGHRLLTAGGRGLELARGAIQIVDVANLR